MFDKTIKDIEHWQAKLIRKLALKLVDDVKAKSMPYRHDHWVSMTELSTKEPFILSYSAGEMFQLLVTRLHNLENDLSTTLFNSTLRLIASTLDDFFIDSMIMNTKFSCFGAAQFKFDMTRNLIPLFGQYSRRPMTLFKKCVINYFFYCNLSLWNDSQQCFRRLYSPDAALRTGDASPSNLKDKH